MNLAEYLQTEKPKMYKKGATASEKALARSKHLLGKVTPISVQQTAKYGVRPGVSGFVGHPIYGKKE